MNIFDKNKLFDLIDTYYWCMDEAEKEFWDRIKVEPQIWTSSPSGINEYEFWVVGIIGQQVVWYNSIEEGFELSGYSSLGVISDYQATQAELHSIIKRIYPWSKS